MYLFKGRDLLAKDTTKKCVLIKIFDALSELIVSLLFTLHLVFSTHLVTSGWTNVKAAIVVL
jgi:hypothetical protein